MTSRFTIQEYSLAQVARYALTARPEDFNLFTKTFVDVLSHPSNRSPERQYALIEEEPVLLPHAWMNVFLAGVAELIARRADIEPPLWTEKPERFLPKPLIYGFLPETRAYMIRETPGPFRRRNLFCGFVSLQSKRWSTTADDDG